MGRSVLALLLALVLVLLVLSCAKQGEEKAEPKQAMADPVAELAKSVERGKKLFEDASLGTSGSACISCHVEGGVKDAKMGEKAVRAFVGLSSKYPAYFAGASRVMTLSQVNDFCLVNALKGEALKWDDQRLADLTAYAASVKGMSEIKADPEMEKVAAEALARSVEAGKALFEDKSLGTSGSTCSTCHAEGGAKAGKMGEMDIPAFDGVAEKYPRYMALTKKVMTLSQVTNVCITNPLKGEALAWDDQRLADLSAYMASVKPAAQ
jgi:cytochrome c